MSIEIMSRAWKTGLKSHQHKLVLLSMSDNANDEGVCWPSVANLCRRCSMSESSVHRAIAALVDGGHITKRERPGRSTYFTVHPCQDDTPVTQTPGGATQTPRGCQDDTPGVSHRHPESSIESSNESSENRQAAKRGSRKVPESWQLSPETRGSIIGDPKCAGVDIERELAKMRNFEFRSPRKNWDLTFYNWCLTAGSKAPATTATGKPDTVRLFVPKDDGSGELDMQKFVVADLKPWEQTKLAQLRKQFKSKTIFYRTELNDRS